MVLKKLYLFKKIDNYNNAYGEEKGIYRLKLEKNNDPKWKDFGW